jgi:hypothetical protein
VAYVIESCRRNISPHSLKPASIERLASELEVLVVRKLIVLMGCVFFAILPGTTQAKGPLADLQLCGVSACVNIDDAATVPLSEAIFFWYTDKAAPAEPQTYYLLRWSGGVGAMNTEHAFWMPSAGLIRRFDPLSLSARWKGISGSLTGALQPAATGLQPFPLPELTRVVVGHRVARDPRSYVSLLSGGTPVKSWAAARGWLRVRMASVQPSPWTDVGADLKISRTGGFVWRDGSVFRIPLRLARLVRTGTSLAAP